MCECTCDLNKWMRLVGMTNEPERERGRPPDQGAYDKAAVR